MDALRLQSSTVTPTAEAVRRRIQIDVTKKTNYLCISKISWDAKVPVRLTCFVWEMVLIEIVCFSTSDFWAPPLTRPRTDFRSAPGSKESLGFGSDNSDVELTSSRNKQAQRAVGIRRSDNVDKLHDFPGWFSLQFTSFHMISYGKTLPTASDFPKKNHDPPGTNVTYALENSILKMIFLFPEVGLCIRSLQVTSGPSWKRMWKPEKRRGGWDGTQNSLGLPEAKTEGTVNCEINLQIIYI